ncbi:hypothetical protein ABEB36_013656 [Hypothenemus hampei]|uniref:Bestrophin homolog n=1 Tax=Hypothenemus hampei TaxID=57062 RepID=A0ABD1E5V2_HYPHA
MTVTYSHKVTTSSGLGIFLKLLVRWKGSIYKMVWADLLLYLAVYYILNLIYLFALNDHGKKSFIELVTFFSKYGNAIPLSFVLGFFVNAVYTRWWNQYSSIPYPDHIAILVGTSIHGKDERSKMMRRSIIRYVCVAFIMTLTMISPKVKKRFPTLRHFVEAGLLNTEETKFIEHIDKDYPTYSSKYWLPLAWAANITSRARVENLLDDDFALRDILESINSFREKCKLLRDYDWICIPLVYTQVVTLAVYLYFLFTVIGSQFVEEQAEGHKIFFQFPLIPCVQFFFYMGWLKVAESLINPFGEDDDDFEVNWMIDRHLQVGYLLVDKIHNDHPKLMKDYHWNQVAPHQLPFTVASKKFMNEHPVESTFHVNVNKGDQDLIFTDDLKHFEEPPYSDSNIVRKLFSGKKHDTSYHLRRVSVEHETDNEETTEFLEPPAEEICHQTSENKKQEETNKLKADLLKLINSLKENKEETRKILDEILK